MPGPPALTQMETPHLCADRQANRWCSVCVAVCAEHSALSEEHVVTQVALANSLRLSEACAGDMRVGGNINSAQENQPFALRMGVLEEEVWYTGGRQGRQEVRGCVLFQPQPLWPLPLSNMCICFVLIYGFQSRNLRGCDVF